MKSDMEEGPASEQDHPSLSATYNTNGFTAKIQGIYLCVECGPTGWDAYMLGPRLWKTSAHSAEEGKKLAEEAAREFLPAQAVIEWEGG